MKCAPDFVRAGAAHADCHDLVGPARRPPEHARLAAQQAVALPDQHQAGERDFRFDAFPGIGVDARDCARADADAVGYDARAVGWMPGKRNRPRMRWAIL